MSTPEGWQSIAIDHAVTLAVPGDARAEKVQPIDSLFGMLRGQGYEIVYDYGRSAESLTDNKDQPGYRSSPRTIGGRPGTEVAFAGDAKPWGVVHIAQARNGPDVLTLRVSCADEPTCRIAPIVFDSVQFTAR